MGRWKKKSIYIVIKRFRKRLAKDFYYAILKCDDMLKLTELNNMLVKDENSQRPIE